MKKLTKTVEVKKEAYTYEEVTYQCEECEYSTKDKEEAQQHHAAQHSFKCKKNVGGFTFLWFSSAEDYREYHQQESPSDLMYDATLFTAPGWYGLKAIALDCRCGKCNDYGTAGVHATVLREDLREQVDALQAKIEEAERQHDEILDLCNNSKW